MAADRPVRADGALPDGAYLLAMATLPEVGPATMRAALAEHPAAEAWDRLRVAAVAKGHRVTVEPAAVWARHVEAGVRVLWAGHPQWPPVLADDLDPPAVLVCRGDLGALDQRLVGVVGTRRASQYGLEVARNLGRRLGRAAVGVVSGLALGIDGAAHRGLLVARHAAPVAVVATGVDVAYPRRHRDLWAAVAEAGVILSEAPLGTPPAPWRFPARNRIIAALSEAVVVVESKARGGSLYTAEFALDRGRPLFAVPGPITSPRAVGTNRLLADGAHPYTDPADVLVALGLPPTAGIEGVAAVEVPRGPAGRVLDATRHEVVTLQTLVARSGLTLPEVATAIQELIAAGWLVDRGGHYEPATPTPDGSGP